MESPAAGGASPAPEAPPPPPRGWISGLVSGAGRILASVLGPDSPAAASGSATTTSATSPSASSSPASSRHPGYIRDHGNSPLFFPKANKLNKSENEAIMKDYSEASLAIISEIEPKDAIMQLLKQETYSRSECNALVKIIQERVVDSNLNGVDAGGLALPINWKTGRQANIGYSSLSPKGLLPATSIPPVQDHVFDNSAGAGASTTIAHDRGPFAHATDKIQSVLKRSCSVATDTPDPEDSRRVRPKINGNSLEISNFKQVDVIRTHSDSNSCENLIAKNHNSFGCFSGDDNKLSDVPLFGTNNLIYSNIVSIVGSADEKIGIPNKPSAGDDNKNYDSEFLNPCTNKDLKNSFPLKVEPLDVCIPFEQQMMDLSHQKHEHAACDDSCSVSKLMFKEDIETALSLPVGVPLENGSKNRRRRAPNTQRITPARSPAKGSRRKSNDVTVKSETDLLEQSKGSHDATVKSEIDLLEQSKLALMEQSPDLGDIPVKRPVGRPRKAK
ncbi:hypothetical protein OsI_23974 [Oryza sativa Indica Group]|uniref:Uncharacterized protein n=1 Tax=Oryza sativa subsp. indica TaxID=39946 RepID=B8B0Z3_ORYSI|nr:hypothetical protein OsI_23974 [Oryza sativa Indica Group]